MAITVNCAWCGKEKQVKPHRVKENKNHFCGVDCHNHWRAISTNHYNYKGGKVAVNCAWCGKEKQVLPAIKRYYKNHFCRGADCQAKYNAKHFRGESSPAWRGGRFVAVNCAYCKKSFTVTKYRASDYKNNFCSPACHSSWVKENQVLRNNPNWRGGISFEPYPVAWNGNLKEKVRERDARTCQHCGKPEAESRRKLDVHHIDYNKDNLDPENLISLCNSCHGKTHGRREYWKGYFIRLRASRWTRIKNFWLAEKIKIG